MSNSRDCENSVSTIVTIINPCSVFKALLKSRGPLSVLVLSTLFLFKAISMDSILQNFPA